MCFGGGDGRIEGDCTVCHSRPPFPSQPEPSDHATADTEHETPHSSVIMATRAQPRTALATMVAFGAGVAYVLWRRARSMGVSTLHHYIGSLCLRKHPTSSTRHVCCAIIVLHRIFVFIELKSASIWTTQVLTSLVSNNSSISNFYRNYTPIVSFGYNTQMAPTERPNQPALWTALLRVVFDGRSWIFTIEPCVVDVDLRGLRQNLHPRTPLNKRFPRCGT